MLKKCSKILIAILFVFLISLIATNTVNAKEMTLDELTQAIIEYNPDVADIYIIGNYVFTSEFNYELEDIMLSARSIEVTDVDGKTNQDAIHGEMSMLHYEGTFDSDWNLTGFTPMTQLAGVAESANTFNVEYIDYNRFIATIDLKAIAEETYSEYTDKLAPSVGTEKINSDITSIKATIKDLSVLPKDEVKALANKFFGTEGVKSITITLTPVDGTPYEKEITSADLETILNMSKEEFSTKAGIDFEKMVGGNITAKVNLEEGYKAKDGVDTFTSEINAEIDVKAIADAAYGKYVENKDKLSNYVSVEREDVVNFYAMLKTVIIDIDSVPVDKIKSLAKEYSDKFFSVPGIKSVTVTLTALDGTTYEKEVTQDDIEALINMTNDELKVLVKEYIKTSGITVDSVIGGVISAKVNLKDGYTAKDNVDTFNTKLEAEIDFKGLANAAYNKYDSNYASKLADYVVAKKSDNVANEDAIKLELTTKVLIPDTSLIPEEVVNKIKDKINELKTEYKDEIEEIKDLLDKVTYVPGFESLTLTITSAEGEVITKTITEAEALALKDKSVDELKELVKQYATSSDITLDSIIGGEVAVKINLKDGYMAKDGADTFKVLLNAEIDFKEIANTVYDKYESNYASKLENYVATKKLDTTVAEDAIKLDITAKVLTTDLSLIPEDKINELKNEYKDEIQKAKDLLDKVTYIPGMESVTVTLTTSDEKVITANITEAEALALKDKSVDELKALVKEYVKASGLTIDSIIGGEVAVKVNLKDGYLAKDGADTFKALFKAEYDLETLANKAYNKFDTDYSMLLTSFATVEQKNSTEYNVTVKTTDETALTQLATQLKAQAGDIFSKISSVPGVDTITIKLTTSDSRTFDKDITVDNIITASNMSVDEIKAYLKELAKKHNLDVNSILGGSVEAKINFKKGFSAKNGKDTFKINFLASEYNVIFDIDGVKTVETVKVGDTVSKPSDPTKEGCTFDKWLLNGSEYNFSTPINYPITLKASWKENTYEVTIAIPDTDNGYGTLTKTSVTVKHGTTVTIEGNVLKIGDVEVVATPASNTEQYKYSFDKWVGAPADIRNSLVITARFKRSDSLYKVDLIAGEDGTVSESLVEDVKYGTAIETDGNVLKIGDKEITATPKTKDAEYTYSFDNWTISESTVTKDLEIKANFKKEVNNYTVTFEANDTNYGTVNKSSITVPYGTKITTSGNKIIIGQEEILATPKESTQIDSYSFINWSNVPNTITGATTITANFEKGIGNCIVTIKADSEMGTVSKSTVTVPYGSTVSVSGDILTIGTETIKAKPNTATSQNSYSFVDWSNVPNTITGATTITANFKKWTIVDVDNLVNTAITTTSSQTSLIDISGLTNNTITLEISGTVYMATGTDMPKIMENLSTNDVYKSVVWDHEGYTLNLSNLDYTKTSFSDFIPGKTNSNTALIARFVSKVGGYSGTEGSDLYGVNNNTLIENTATTPIKMKIKLKDGYCTANGKTEVTYNVVFAK